MILMTGFGAAGCKTDSKTSMRQPLHNIGVKAVAIAVLSLLLLWPLRLKGQALAQTDPSRCPLGRQMP